MAKKKETKVEVEAPQLEDAKLHPEDRYKVEKPKVKEIGSARKVLDDLKEKQKDTITKKLENWEIKDRIYYLQGVKKPLSHTVKSSNIYWFDEEKGFERELKYCQNQRTPFVDEMKGDQRLEHIVFRSGVLFVEKEKTVLQKLLSLYHPHREKIFYEHKPQVIAETQLDYLVLEVQALTEARNMDISLAEAIMRVEIGSNVSNMSSKELRRDILLFARSNPKLFLDLASDDNVVLRNFGVKAVEAGIIRISGDQRHFIWTSNKRKVMTIPFDEHPYSALAHWFKTDEGMEVYSSIEKRLN